MSFNVPSFTENNISFGPGILKIGASGATPTVDVGAITEDGITLTPKASKKVIKQGNPKIGILPFIQEVGFDVDFVGIEWNLNTLPYAIGAGNTTSSGSADTFSFGGDPIVKTVAIHIQHEMAVSGHTMDAYVWKAASMQDDLAVKLAADEHQFPRKYGALRSATDWAGGALPKTERLIKIVRTK